MTDKTGKAIKDALASIQQAIQQQVPGGQGGGVSISVETDPEALTTLSQSVVYFLAPGTWTAFSPAVTVPAGKFGIAKYGTAWAVTVLGGVELASAIAAMTAADELTGDEALPMGSGESVTVQQLAEFAEGVVGGNAAHVSGETADQAKLASVGKVEELISEIDSGGGSISIDTAIDPANPSTTKAPSSKAVADYVADYVEEHGTGGGGGGSIAPALELDPEATDEAPSSKAVAEYVAATVEGTYVDTEIDESNPSQDKMPTCEAVVEYVTYAIEDTYVTTDAASVQTSIPKSPDDTHVPSSKAVADFVSARMGVKEPIIGENILDSYNAKEYIGGNKINISNADIGQPFSYSAESGYKITGRIPVIGGAVYYFKKINSYTLAIFDSDDKLIKVLTGSAMSSTANHVEVMPANAAWIRCHYATKATQGVMVTFGEYKYKSNIDMDVSGTAEAVLNKDFTDNYRQVVPTLLLNIELIREMLTADHQYDYWKGKKLFVDGDSISHYLNNQPFWQQHVANNLRMEFVSSYVENFTKDAGDEKTEEQESGSTTYKYHVGDRGYGGARLCPVIEQRTGSQGTTVAGPKRRCLLRRIIDIPTTGDNQRSMYDVDADLFLIFIGTNDWSHSTDLSAKLGSIDDAPFNPTGFNWGSTNVAHYKGVTFYGCLKYLVEWFIKNKPKADLVLLTPIKRESNIGGVDHVETALTHHYADPDSDTGATLTETVTLADYAKAIREVGELYGVPVCDLFSNCFMNPSTALGQDATLVRSSTGAGYTQLNCFFDREGANSNGTDSRRSDTTHPGRTIRPSA